jgi:formate hydrogenlyase transcriptional activator
VESTVLSSLAERFHALLAVADAVTTQQDLEDLLRSLARHVQHVVHFDRVDVVVLQPERGVTSVRVVETSAVGFTTFPEFPIDAHHARWVIEAQQPLVVPDTAVETRWPRAMAALRQDGITSFCSLPLTTARRRIGAVGFGRREPVKYTTAQVDFLGKVVKLVAVAVENRLAFREIARLTEKLAEQRVGAPEGLASTLEAVERRHILHVLGETNWTLGGTRGAAVRLGMKRTTLQSLMRRLGIVRPRAA